MVFFVFFWKSALANPEKLCKIQILRRTNAGVAQLVERNLAKVEVASSRLVSRSKDPFGTLSHAGDAGVAQLVERNLAKVASSRLVSRSRFQRKGEA